jgi:signal transduction histidine kinase
MPVFKTMSVVSRAWSFPVRLIATIFCFLLCSAIVGLGMVFTHLGSFAALFCIPVAMASWFFKQRGAFICIGSVLLVLAVLNTLISDSVIWFPPMRAGFIIGGSGYFVIGIIISFLAHTMDLATSARIKSEQAEERLQQLQQVRDQFLLNVSHELRTPLTQLRGYLELLHTHSGQLEEATQKRFLDYALRGCDELESLVEGVLDAAETISGVRPPRCEALLIEEVLQDVLTQVDPQTRETFTIRFELSQALAVWADPQYIRQVLRNLLSNAFKYCSTQKAVEISAALDESQGVDSPGMVSLSIKDSGPGIPASEASLLFEKFVRLKRDLSGSTPGTGLGLYICKQLVEAMGGRIWVESAGIPGQGSCFTFTLPRALPAK